MREITMIRKIRNGFGLIGFFVVQFITLSCNLSVPSGGETLALLNNIRKLSASSVATEANITVSGTLKDSAGNIIPGGILDIARSGSNNVLERAPADTKVYADINGKFTMNIYVGSFSIRVSRSDGTFVGSFDLKVNNATDVPQVTSSTGLQVSGIAATPVGTGTTTVSEALKLVFTGLPPVINEGQSVTVQVKLSKAITSNLSLSLSLNNSAIRP